MRGLPFFWRRVGGAAACRMEEEMNVVAAGNSETRRQKTRCLGRVSGCSRFSKKFQKLSRRGAFSKLRGGLLAASDARDELPESWKLSKQQEQGRLPGSIFRIPPVSNKVLKSKLPRSILRFNWRHLSRKGILGGGARGELLNQRPHRGK